MTTKQFLQFVEYSEKAQAVIEALKIDPNSTADRRALSVAATHLETAQLWFANARKDD